MTETPFEFQQPLVSVDLVKPRKKRGRGPARPKVEAAPKLRKQRKPKADRHPIEAVALPTGHVPINVLADVGDMALPLIHILSLLNGMQKADRDRVLHALSRIFA